jgi:hypothetical protein
MSETDSREMVALLYQGMRGAHGFAMRLLGDATERLEDDFRHRTSTHWYSTTNGSANVAGLNGLQALAAVHRGALVIERVLHGVRHDVTVRRVDAGAAQGGKGAP